MVTAGELPVRARTLEAMSNLRSQLSSGSSSALEKAEKNPMAYNNFIGHSVTVNEIYRCLVQHGSQIVQDVLEELHQVELEKENKLLSLAKSANSGRDSRRVSTHGSSSVAVFRDDGRVMEADINDEYNDLYRDYTYWIRIGRAHRNKLIEAQGIYRSLGLTRGSHLLNADGRLLVSGAGDEGVNGRYVRSTSEWQHDKEVWINGSGGNYKICWSEKFVTWVIADTSGNFLYQCLEPAEIVPSGAQWAGCDGAPPYPTVEIPRYETAIKVRVNKIDSFPLLDIATYVKCSIIGDDGGITVFRSTEDAPCIPCDGRRPCAPETAVVKAAESIKAKKTRKGSLTQGRHSRLSRKLSRLLSFDEPKEQNLIKVTLAHDEGVDVVNVVKRPWQCTTCGFPNPGSSDTCLGGTMSWDCEIEFMKSEFRDGDGLEFTVWQDAWVRSQGTTSATSTVDEYNTEPTLLGHCILTHRDMMMGNGSLNFDGKLPILSLHRTLLDLDECFLHVVVNASMFEGEVVITNAGRFNGEYLCADGSASSSAGVCMKAGSPENDVQALWKIYPSQNGNDCFFISPQKKLDAYICAGTEVHAAGRQVSIGTPSDLEFAEWKIVPCDGCFYIMHASHKEYICAEDDDGSRQVVSKVGDRTLLDATAKWTLRAVHDVGPQRRLSARTLSHASLLNAVAPSRERAQSAVGAEDELLKKASPPEIKTAERTLSQDELSENAIPPEIKTAERTVSQAFLSEGNLARKGSGLRTATRIQIDESTPVAIEKVNENIETYQKEIDELKAQLHELRGEKATLTRGRSHVNETPIARGKSTFNEPMSATARKTRKTKLHAQDTQTEPDAVPQSSVEEVSEKELEWFRRQVEESRDKAEGLQCELEWLRNSLNASL